MPKTEFPEKAKMMTSEKLFNLLQQYMEFPEGVCGFTIHATFNSFVMMDVSYYPRELSPKDYAKLAHERNSTLSMVDSKYRLVEIEDAVE